MEYVQERITTLHDFGRRDAPPAPTDRAAVVVPMTEREYTGLAAERVLSALEPIRPAHVVVPIRAPADRVGPFREWLTDFELPVEVLWCNGPTVERLLDDHGLDGERGKGRDVWLALGRAVAADVEYVAVHDADTKSYDETYVPRLLFPLAQGFEFTKGYYARVEEGRLYGRLFRLFFAPLVRALEAEHDADVIRYLAAFRYALAGEFAATTDLAQSIRVQRSWGLEVGTLGDAFDAAGFEGSAQVDLGRYEHDHRSVGGPTGLTDMSRPVGEALFHLLADHDVVPDFDALQAAYLETARSMVDQYATDAAFNGFAFDAAEERTQVRRYADAVRPPGEDRRLPPWNDAPITPAEVREAADTDWEAIR